MYEPTACVPMLAKATRSSELSASAGTERVASIMVGSSIISPVTYCIAIDITAPTTTKNEPASPCPSTPAQKPEFSFFVRRGTSAIPPTRVITNAKFASIEII